MEDGERRSLEHYQECGWVSMGPLTLSWGGEGGEMEVSGLDGWRMGSFYLNHIHYSKSKEPTPGHNVLRQSTRG